MPGKYPYFSKALLRMHSSESTLGSYGDTLCSRKYWMELSLAVWPKTKLKWNWQFLIWWLKLLIIHHINNNSTHWWRPCLWWNSSLSKAVFKDITCQTILDSNILRGAVLQTGAQEHHWSTYAGWESVIWFIYGSWPCGMKSDFYKLHLYFTLLEYNEWACGYINIKSQYSARE